MPIRPRSLLLGVAVTLTLGLAASRGAALALGRPTRAPTQVASPPRNPLADLIPAHETFRGEVVERLAAGPYSYLRVATGDTSRWVVVLGHGEEVGRFVEARSFGSRQAFHSARLERDFDVLCFVLVHPIESPSATKESP